MYGGKTTTFTVTGYESNIIKLSNVPDMPDISVKQGSSLSAALNTCIPEKQGYMFDGWYLDNSFTQKIDEKNQMSNNTTVYAKWTKVYHGKLNKVKATVKKGKKVQLSVKGLSKKKVTWKTSNKKIAAVSKSGVVKAKKSGSVTITAITPDGSVFTCKIKVKK